MTEIKSPGKLPKTVFLAGSIEMGEAENWQERVAGELSDVPNLTILNPRRDDWDRSWVQSIADRQFREHARSGKVIVCCPDGFWRKGNVEVVCNRFGIPLSNDLDDAIERLKISL